MLKEIVTFNVPFGALGDIIEKGIREHPELSVGMTTEGIEVRSVGNTLTLHETALIEAFNLKAAIEYQLKNCKIIAATYKIQTAEPTGKNYFLRQMKHLGKQSQTCHPEVKKN